MGSHLNCSLLMAPKHRARVLARSERFLKHQHGMLEEDEAEDDVLVVGGVHAPAQGVCHAPGVQPRSRWWRRHRPGSGWRQILFFALSPWSCLQVSRLGSTWRWLPLRSFDTDSED